MSISITTNLGTQELANIAAVKAYIASNKDDLTEVTSFVGSAEADMSYLFANCPDLVTVNLEGLTNTSVMTNMSHMFFNDPCLGIIVFPTDINTSNVTDMSFLFAFNGKMGNAINAIDKFLNNTFNIDYSYMMDSYKPYLAYYNRDQIRGLIRSSLETDFRLYPNLHEFYFDLNLELSQLNPTMMSDLGLPKSFKYDYNSDILNMADAMLGDAQWDSTGTIISGDFGEDVYLYDYSTSCAELKELLDAAKLKPEASVSYFYDDKEYMKSRIDYQSGRSYSFTNLEKFDTSAVTSFKGMFYGCHAAINSSLFHNKWDMITTSATDMSYMFAYCSMYSFANVCIASSITGSSLHSVGIDLLNFNTSNVVDMSYMFKHAFNSTYGSKDSLYALILGSYSPFRNWDVKKLKRCDSMFEGCTRMIGAYTSDDIYQNAFSLGIQSYNDKIIQDTSGEYTYRTAKDNGGTAGFWLKFNSETARTIQVSFGITSYTYATCTAQADINLNGSSYVFGGWSYGSPTITKTFNVVAGENNFDMIFDYGNVIGVTITFPNNAGLSNFQIQDYGDLYRNTISTNVARIESARAMFYNTEASRRMGKINLNNFNFSNCTDLSGMLCNSSVTGFKAFERFNNLTAIDNMIMFAANGRTNIDISNVNFGDNDICMDYLVNTNYGNLIIGNALKDISVSLHQAFTHSVVLNEPYVLGTLEVDVDLTGIDYYEDTISFNQYFYESYSTISATFNIDLSDIPTEKVTGLSLLTSEDNVNITLPSTGDYTILKDLSYYGCMRTLAQMNLGQFANCHNIEDISNLFWKYVPSEDDDVFEELAKLDLSKVKVAYMPFFVNSNTRIPCNTNDISFMQMPLLEESTGLFAYVRFTQAVDFSGIHIANSVLGLFNYVEFPANFSLATLDIDSSITSLQQMFSSAVFTDFTPLQSLVTSNITNISEMLYNIEVKSGYSTAIDFTSMNWNVSNITDASEFLSNAKITSVNFTGLNFTSLTNVTDMCACYQGCLTYCNLGGFKATVPVNVNNMFLGFDSPGNFVIAEDFNYLNLTTYDDVNNVQFLDAILSSGVITSLEGVCKSQTLTWDTFKTRFVDTYHLCTVNSNNEFVFNDNITNFSRMFAGATINQGSHDFILNSSSAENVSYMFTSATLNTPTRMNASNATDFTAMFRNASTASYLSYLVTNSDRILSQDVSLPAGTVYLNILTVRNNVTITLNDVYINGTPYSWVLDNTLNLASESFTRTPDTNTYTAPADLGSTKMAMAVFKITLPEASTAPVYVEDPNTVGDNSFYTHVKILAQQSLDLSNYEFNAANTTVSDMLASHIYGGSDYTSFINATTRTTQYKSSFANITLDNIDFSNVIDFEKLFYKSDVYSNPVNGTGCGSVTIKDCIVSDSCTNLSRFLSASAESVSSSEQMNFVNITIDSLSCPNVTDMSHLFDTSGDYLSKLVFKNVYAPNVTDLSYFLSGGVYNYNYIDTNILIDACTFSNLLDMSYFIHKMGVTTGITFGDMSNFNTSHVTNFACFFKNDTKLNTANIDLTWIDTSSATNMSEMFYSALKGSLLDLHLFNVSNVTNMYQMFYKCGVDSLILDGWSLDSIDTELVGFFSGMSNITSVSMINFDFGSAEKITYLFENCTNLATVTGPILGDNVKEIGYWFKGTDKYKTFSDTLFSGFWPTLQKMYNMVQNSSINVISYTGTYPELLELHYAFMIAYNAAWVNNSDLTFAITAPKLDDVSYAFATIPVKNSPYKLDLSNCHMKPRNWSYAFSNCTCIRTVEIDSSIIGEDANMSHMFWHTTGIAIELRKVTFTGNNIKPSKTDYMFYRCVNVTSIDLSMFDFSDVTDASYMFNTCSVLTQVNLGATPSFDKCTTMAHMFGGCNAIQTVDLGTWHVPKLLDVNSMFINCSKHPMVNIKPFVSQIAGATQEEGAAINTFNLSYFYNTNETSIDLSGLTFNTKNYDAFASTFYNISNVTSLDMHNTTINNTDDSPLYMYFHNNMPNILTYNFSGLTINGAISYIYQLYGQGYSTNPVQSIDLSNVSYTTKNDEKVCVAFSNLAHLQSVNLTNFSCTGVNGVEALFENCTALTSVVGLTDIDLSGIVEANRTFHNMFAYCTSLPSIDLSSWDASTITSTNMMFYHCDSLASITLPTNLLSVTNADSMFACCAALTSISLQPFAGTVRNTIPNLQSASGLFNECTALTTVNCGQNSDNNTLIFTGFVNSSPLCMFEDCASLVTFNLSMPSVTSLSSAQYEQAYVGMFSNCTSLTTVSLFNMASCGGYRAAFTNCTALQSVSIQGSVTRPYMMDFTYICDGCTSLTDFDVDITWEQTAKEIGPQLKYAFRNCSSLVTLDFFKDIIFDSIPEDMQNAFEGCSNLTTLNIYKCLQNPLHSHSYSHTSLNSMFKNCSKLTTVDLSDWSVRMYGSGYYIDVGNMFEGCTALTTAKLLGNANRAYNHAEYMFKNCTHLTSVTMPREIQSFKGMFYGCTSLTTLPTLELSGTDFTEFFYGCTGLVSIKFAWGTISNINLTDTFTGCSNLETIFCNQATPSSVLVQSTFDGCTKLVGNAGTSSEKRYNPSHISSAYAQCTDGYYTLVPISFFFNGTECDSLVYNSTNIDSLYWNGTKVF